jgi:hypothetical protein
MDEKGRVYAEGIPSGECRITSVECRRKERVNERMMERGNFELRKTTNYHKLRRSQITRIAQITPAGQMTTNYAIGKLQ